MGRTLDDIPLLQILRDLRQILLCLGPFVAPADLNPGTYDDKWRIGHLDMARRLDLGGSHGLGDKVFLQLGLEEFVRLVRAAAVDAVLACAALEQGAEEAVQA